MKLWEGNVFTGVCLSTGDHTPGTIPLDCTPWDCNAPGTIPSQDIHPLGPYSHDQLLTPSDSQHMFGQQADGMHPTGIHSYFILLVLV